MSGLPELCRVMYVSKNGPMNVQCLVIVKLCKSVPLWSVRVVRDVLCRKG